MPLKSETGMSKIVFSVKYILEELYPGCEPTNLNKINIFHKRITKYLKKENYEIFKNVSEIQAQGNRLPLHIFSSFPSLKILSLERNQIENFKKTIYCFPALTFLDLSGNNINPDDLLKLGFLESLKELNLSRNEIHYLPHEFSNEGNFPSLETLRLDQNFLRTQNTFLILSKLPKLSTLNLDSNCFEEVPYLMFMKSNKDYDDVLSNGLKLLQSYGHFLEEHHVRYRYRKLYQIETPIVSCSFTSLDMHDLIIAKNVWIQKRLYEKDTKNQRKMVDNKQKATINKTNERKDEKTNFLEDSFKIFDRYMENKLKLKNTVSLGNLSIDEELSHDDSDIIMEKEDMIPEEFNKFIDTKVDRSIYELDFVPFPRLENISLQKCEFCRQVTILSVVIWPSICQLNLSGNRLFAQTSHPGNIKAIMKFFKKAGVTIVTGYHFASQIPDEKFTSNTSNENIGLSRSYIQQKNNHGYWRKRYEQKYQKGSQPSKWDELCSSVENKKEISGVIDLKLGQRPPFN